VKHAWRRVAAVILLVASLAAGCSSHQSSSTTGRTTALGPAPAAANWLTYQHDAARSGAADDLRAFGAGATAAWTSDDLDGNLYAQPLVVGDAVIAATEGDSVYSLDAHTGKVRWRTPLGDPVDGSTLPCGNINPSGITSTPVVDLATSTIYVAGFFRDGPHHDLIALDLATGMPRWRRAVDAPGLDPRVEQQRGALSLSGGQVLVPYGGLAGDCGQYKGALVSVPSTGAGPQRSYVVGAQREAGIWNPGGETVDPSGDVFVATGNGSSTTGFDFGDAVIRLGPDLAVRDYFAADNFSQLNMTDTDLGSMTPVLLPGGGVLVAGKDGIARLLNKADLGHVSPPRAALQSCSGVYGAAAVVGDTVYLPCNDSLVALRAGDATLAARWRAPGGTGPPIVAYGHLWAISLDGQLRQFNPDNGQVDYRRDLGPSVTRFAAPSAGAGVVLVPTGSHLSAFSPGRA
jgi:outer membrane protein assembly factor BamB